jgi:hypothetical protein
MTHQQSVCDAFMLLSAEIATITNSDKFHNSCRTYKLTVIYPIIPTGHTNQQ